MFRSVFIKKLNPNSGWSFAARKEFVASELLPTPDVMICSSTLEQFLNSSRPCEEEEVREGVFKVFASKEVSANFARSDSGKNHHRLWRSTHLPAWEL